MPVLHKRNKRTIWAAALVFIVFLACSLLFVFSVRQKNEQRIQESLAEATNQRRDAVQQQMRGDLQVLRGIAVTLAEMDLTGTEPITPLLDTINRSNTFVRMGFASPEGLVDFITLEGEVIAGVDLSGLDAFQQAVKGDEVISETFYEDTIGGYVNYYMVPVTQNDTVVGILCAVNMDTILESIIAVPVIQGLGYFAVIDNAGNIVSPTIDPNPNVQLGASIFNIIKISVPQKNRLMYALRNNAGGSYVFNVDGVEQLSVVVPLNENDWFIISVVPHNALNTYYNQTAVGTTVIIAAACLVFMLLLIGQIRAMAKNQKDLEYLAYVDQLTGLRNYAKLLIDAQTILRTNPDKSFALWSLDLRKFNNINDIFGIATGNEILVQLATLLKAREDERTIACRIAADQFVGIGAYRSKQDIVDLFWSLQKKLSMLSPIAHNQIKLDCSMGLYCIDEFDETLAVDEMANRAAIAKKKAKETSGSQVAFFTGEMREKMHWSIELEAGASRALEDGEMQFYLQPKVDIQGCYCISGAEALARWIHPKHGFIPPSGFIPLFENNGFIVQLDRYIFEQACKWLSKYLATGHTPITLSINVSRWGLLWEDFLPYYIGIKQKYNIPNGLLELEFTESIVFNNYSLFHDMVLQLQKAGFICSIDDFGSGYSSLNVLKTLPIDVLKLDAAFFRDSEDVHRSQTVISGFIRLAHMLGVKTVAEGVERPTQVRFLQEAGCDTVQGFVFSKPLPPNEFEQLAEHNDFAHNLELPSP